MKYFEPYNRYLWIEILEEQKEEKETSVLLPENYKPQESEFAVVKLKDGSPDCKRRWARGENLIVERRMIREIKLGDKSFHTILENYVLGVIK
jgi:hypothetical protein